MLHRKLFPSIFICLIVIVIGNGRPQNPLGGFLGENPRRYVSITPQVEKEGNIFKISFDRQDLSGLVRQIQTFLGNVRDNTRQENEGLVEIQPSTSPSPSILPIPDADPKLAVSPPSSPKCEDDELMYEPDGKCYKTGVVTVGIDSPCIDDFYEFQKIEDKPGYGTCYCVTFRGTTTRPVVRWDKSNRCYWLYDQGPCEVGQWLVFNNSSDPDGGSRGLMCTERTCPDNPEEEKLSAFPKFWFEHMGKCYKTETANPEFCGGDEKKKIYFSNEKPKPVCLDRRPPPSSIRGLAGDRGVLACKAGQKQLPNGECKRVALFDFK